ncbi:DUF1178 family protein [Asticcacaulis sp. EMRT-3]|uniref:DUF1178 family protein n=1 Tax=Asticcacaulis sp. EMRT-3 TaxID=3040349 RepID=UPI0024AEC8F3|nr:DUF1178 family protein [Asticcacaulis sp. EMRT-3]MDI7775332.1 DUF1178 family protein [Asticcacaulis sp. EMRT-3]
MIRYALKCDVGHEFEAWFDSSDGYDAQTAKGLVACPMCGSVMVSKAIMAPMVRTGKQADETAAKTQRAVAEAMHRLRQHVEKTHDYVGGDFASEARDIHHGLAPDRPIYGEATQDEVKSLVEEGVPVAPLPVSSPGGVKDGALPVPETRPAQLDKKLN